MANSDIINDLLGNIGFSFSKVVDKVKEGATKASEMAKQVSPQYQAAQTAMSQFRGGGSNQIVTSTTSSGRTIKRRAPVDTAIPTTTSSYKTGTGIGAKLNAMSKKIFGKQSVFGIPTIVAAPVGIGIGWTIFKKLSGKR